MTHIDDAIKAVLSAIDPKLAASFRKLLTIEGGLEIVTKFISNYADPSEVTLKQIRKERKKGMLSSKYGW